MSETETAELISRIEQTGFLDLAGTGELKEEDPIYKNAPASVETGAGGHILKVKDKMIEVDQALIEYSKEPIIKTLEIVNSFQPEESHIYAPETILLWIFPVENSESIVWYPATPIPPIQKWPESIISLETLMASTGNNYAYVTGSSSETLFEMHGFFPSGKVYTENDQEYYVVACPVIP